MVRVKICGITNIEDAMAAVEAGADALGFVFADSPRKVDVKTVSGILPNLPPFITTVGVFADQDVDAIHSIMESTRLHFAQIHGEAAGLHVLGEKAHKWGPIRGIRVKSGDDLDKALRDRWALVSAAVLLDSHVEGKMGGTGQVFDWELALAWKTTTANLPDYHRKPIILAGGLTPENVEEAVRTVRPYAVDVSTGVEAYPGKKDHQKIKEFIENAKRCG